MTKDHQQIVACSLVKAVHMNGTERWQRRGGSACISSACSLGQQQHRRRIAVVLILVCFEFPSQQPRFLVFRLVCVCVCPCSSSKQRWFDAGIMWNDICKVFLWYIKLQKKPHLDPLTSGCCRPWKRFQSAFPLRSNDAVEAGVYWLQIAVM